MIKVSVIVPVYNVEPYIEKCLESLVNQTLKEIEVIVINDGSPDRSQEIIDKYVKKYSKKIKSFKKENGGQGSARNLGLDKAKGEYISFIDSDDWIDTVMLEDMYNLAKKNDSDIVICDMVDHYIDKEIYHDCTNYSSVFEVTASACNKIFKKSVIGNFKFIPKIWYEDFNFTTKILFNTDKISCISKGFYHCNCGHVSTMNNNNSIKNLDILIALDDIIEYSKQKNVYDKNIISYLIYDHLLITSINRVALQKNKDKKVVIKKMINYCHENIADYKSLPFYEKIEKNRKIIGMLNYNNLWFISKILIKIKSIIK